MVKIEKLPSNNMIKIKIPLSINAVAKEYLSETYPKKGERTANNMRINKLLILITVALISEEVKRLISLRSNGVAMPLIA